MERRLGDHIQKLYKLSNPRFESVTNEMHRCITENGIYYVRATNYKPLEEQEAEIQLLRALKQYGIGVPAIVQSIHNRFLEQIDDEGTKTLVVFDAAPGIHVPREHWNEEMLYEVGKEIGRMHRVCQQYMKNDSKPTIKHWHESDEYRFLDYIPEEEIHIRKLADDVLAQIHEIPRLDTNYGIIHGDLWLENILITEDHQVTFIDFQDAERHFYLYDLVVPVYSAMEFSFTGKGNIRDYANRIKAAILKGYIEEHELPQDMLRCWPLFYRLKELFEYALMHMYWNKEQLTEEQVRILNLYRMKLENPIL
ncbi:phosphotransferase enzyme family protein [Paenibacillus sp. 1001270B_150601_E10]|uniref:phosphotransferase enzyme family protein n=1 Tax=Paenibacillus sp. 1001270B_150601_E10 TaxID=2787079 RepID=UPI00189E6307|nr:phosphotransferase [Paenibacillus sp. 1001270B_150601_E10]